MLLTSSRVAHFLPCYNPITIVATVSNKVQAFPCRKDLKKGLVPMLVITMLVTFFPNASPTNIGSMSILNWYLASQSRSPPSRSDDISSASPLSVPNTPSPTPERDVGCRRYCT